MMAVKAVTMHPLEARVPCFCSTLSLIGDPIAMIADALKVTISLIGYQEYVMHCWEGRLQESRCQLAGKPPTIYLIELATSTILVWRQAFLHQTVIASNATR